MIDRILLFIPAYNCEKQITRVLSQLDWEVMSYIDDVIDCLLVCINYEETKLINCVCPEELTIKEFAKLAKRKFKKIRIWKRLS